MKILVVCGAGASSSFVALKLRKAAAARGLEVDAAAGTEAQFDTQVAGCDVALLGAHLTAHEADLRLRAAALGVRVAVLRQASPASISGDEALDLALDTAGAAL